MPHDPLEIYEARLRKLRVLERVVHRNRLKGARLAAVNAALRREGLPFCQSAQEVRDWLYGRFGHRKLSVSVLFWEALMEELKPGFRTVGDTITEACATLNCDFETMRARAIQRAGLVEAGTQTQRKGNRPC